MLFMPIYNKLVLADAYLSELCVLGVAGSFAAVRLKELESPQLPLLFLCQFLGPGSAFPFLELSFNLAVIGPQAFESTPYLVSRPA